MNNNINRRLREDEDDFDIKKLLARFIDHWKLYSVSLVASIILGLLFIRYSTPLYYAHAKVLVQDQDNSSGSSMFGISSSMLQDFGSMFNIKSNVNNELSILQARDLMDKMVRENNLNIFYFRKGRVRSVELYKQSPFSVAFIPLSDSIQSTDFDISFRNKKQGADFSLDGDVLDHSFTGGAKFGDTINTSIGKLCINPTGKIFEPDFDYHFAVTSVDEVVAAIAEKMSFSIDDKEASVISLTYSSSVPQKAEDILNTLIHDYISYNLNQKNQITDSSLLFINTRIGIVVNELNKIEGEIQGFKQRNNIADLSEQAKALIDNTGAYKDKLNEVEVQLNVIKSTLAYIQDERTNSRAVPSTLNADPNFLALVQQYNEMIAMREQQAVSTTDKNPLLKNFDIQIAAVRANMVKSLQNQQKAYEISKQRILSENTQLSGFVQSVPRQEREYVDLSRERDVKQAIYLYLLQKKEETAISKASNIASASIIESPKTEYQAYFPKKSLVLALAFIMGLVIPTAYIILKYALNSRIISKEDITDATDCSILAEIGHSEHSGPFALKDNARTVVAEQFRMFRTNMEFITSNKTCPILLLTSSITGEGKSFIAANLGQVYALSGKKVLLMELDLRKPKLSGMLGQTNDTGFTNFIISGKSVMDFIKKLPDNPNIDVLSSGPVPPNAAELLMKPEVAAMFAELRQQYDIIIMDAPPIGAVTDAQILAKYSDVNLYVIRQGYSYKASMEIINDILEKEKFGNLYLVVNDVKKGASYKYGYGYGYGYGYAYGHSKSTKKKQSDLGS